MNQVTIQLISLTKYMAFDPFTCLYYLYCVCEWPLDYIEYTLWCE
jgi:hypothetical protein